MTEQDLTGTFTTKNKGDGYNSFLEINYSDTFTSDELEVLLKEYREAKRA
jgi:hypothetical protein